MASFGPGLTAYILRPRTCFNARHFFAMNCKAALQLPSSPRPTRANRPNRLIAISRLHASLNQAHGIRHSLMRRPRGRFHPEQAAQADCPCVMSISSLPWAQIAFRQRNIDPLYSSVRRVYCQYASADPADSAVRFRQFLTVEYCCVCTKSPPGLTRPIGQPLDKADPILGKPLVQRPERLLKCRQLLLR